LFTVEPRVLRAGRVMESAAALNAVNHLCALARLLAEREAHAELYDRLEQILDHVDDRRVAPAAIVRFELALLADLGFGLDLDACASTGSRDDLVYVSPKSGRAVSRIAGDPYRDRMLPLPGFLLDDRADVEVDDVLAGFRLAEHFLLRDVFLPRGIAVPDARNAYVRGLAVPP
jgi:DNA repair protein RecO (recombination protein O)